MLTLFLLVAPLATAKVDTLTCAIEGSGAIESTIAAAVYMWASTQRCAKTNSGYDAIKCEIDIASAIKATTDMIDIIVGAVNQCDGAVTENAACGAAVGTLTSAAAGLAAGGGDLAHWLADNSPGGNIVVDATTTKTGKCVVNVGGAAHGLFGAAAGIKLASKGCDGDSEEGCATDVLNVMSIMANMGSAVAHITDQCTTEGNVEGDMTGDILGLVGALDLVAAAGIAIEKSCKVSDSRLFAVEMDKYKEPSTNNSMNLALAALVPIAAVLSFVGGRRIRSRDAERRVIHLGEEVMMDEPQLE